jgi:site-specific recombinase XerD
VLCDSQEARPLPEGAGEWGTLRIIHIYALRHNAVTLLSQGIHPKIVTEMLGHTTISMTLDIYSHVTLHLQQEAVDAMDRLFCMQGGA